MIQFFNDHVKCFGLVALSHESLHLKVLNAYVYS
jgi:hypothetical protein